MVLTIDFHNIKAKGIYYKQNHRCIIVDFEIKNN
jgi:hypothetical protein